MILVYGVDVNAKADENGSTALLEAVRNGTYESTGKLKDKAMETIHLLLAAGADPKAKDVSGDAPLKLAKRQRNYEMVFTLLEPKLKTNVLTKLGYYGFRYNRIQAIAGVGTTLLLITIASAAIIALAIIVIAVILLYLYITFS